MPRVKRGTSHTKKRKRLLKLTKGYKWGRKNQIKRAKEAKVKAGAHAYVDRRKKKRDFRSLWNIRIGAFARERGLSYSKLISRLKANRIEIDRKILSDLAASNKKVLDAVLAKLK